MWLLKKNNKCSEKDFMTLCLFFVFRLVIVLLFLKEPQYLSCAVEHLKLISSPHIQLGE